MGAAGDENPGGAAPEAQGPLCGHGDLRDGFRGQRHRGEAGRLDHLAAEGNKAVRAHSALTMRRGGGHRLNMRLDVRAATEPRQAEYWGWLESYPVQGQ